MRLYPWPLTVDNQSELSEALDIAIGYLEGLEVERYAAKVIVADFKRGINRRLRIANNAIVAAEKNKYVFPQFYLNKAS